jgi:hypothetical protein
MENLTQEYENTIKKARGRTSELHIPTDKQYWVKYYHLKNEDVLCECGAVVSKFCLTKHKKRARHTRALELKNKLITL